jgi:hypothetical protein
MKKNPKATVALESSGTVGKGLTESLSKKKKKKIECLRHHTTRKKEAAEGP